MRQKTNYLCLRKNFQRTRTCRFTQNLMEEIQHVVLDHIEFERVKDFLG